MKINKLLIIDDEEQITKLLEKLLTKKGFSVSTAESGNSAVSLLEKSSYDLIICDYTLPDIDFKSLLYKFLSFNNNYKIILTSGFDPESLIEDQDKKYISGFLSKPFRTNSLIDLIEKINLEN